MDLKAHPGTVAPELLARFETKVRIERENREKRQAEDLRRATEAEAVRLAIQEREHRPTELNRPYHLLKELVRKGINKTKGDVRDVVGFTTGFKLSSTAEGLEISLRVETMIRKIRVPGPSLSEDDFEVDKASLYIDLRTAPDGISEGYSFAQYDSSKVMADLSENEDCVPGFLITGWGTGDVPNYEHVTLNSPSHGLLTAALTEALYPIPQAA